MLLILQNLLTGNLPDAFGLLLFGFLMVGTSTVLRRILGENGIVENEEIVEDRI